MLSPVLTPHGQLLLDNTDNGTSLAPDVAERLISAFKKGQGHGLLQLGAAEVQTVLPAVLSYWREFASRYLASIRTIPDIGGSRTLPYVPAPPHAELDPLVLAPPVMTGAEYLSASVLEQLWNDIDRAFRSEISESDLSIEGLLKSKHPAWNSVGRVHFNLAENRKDEELPFAFLATYTDRLSSKAKPQHIPLGRALSDYAGTANKARLLSLLQPVQRASENCGWLKELVDRGEIYHPLRWSAGDAFQLLNDIPTLESAGVIVRVPVRWRSTRPPRPKVTARVGDKPPSGVGTEALLDFEVDVTLDGQPLTKTEIEGLLARSSGLHFIRGQWIEVDREKLTQLLDQFRDAEKVANESGVSFMHAMRLVSNAASPTGSVPDEETLEWSRIVAGDWLRRTLDDLRHPANFVPLPSDDELRATLRPYQVTGVQWLHLLSQLGLGACLADDMGLGKTMQVLALLLVTQRREKSRKPSILVAPASLLANWISEIQRFAPGLKAIVAHPSVVPTNELRSFDAARVEDTDLVITSYGSLVRIPGFAELSWQLAILDEAQAIKNPTTHQSRAVKRLKANSRIALTGTPVENRLGDLWSIFDFINPGLLGSAREFTEFSRRLANRTHNPYAPLHELVRPYILRRLKTDKSVIQDLPEKTEVKAYCPLSRRQAALYQDSVRELASRLEKTEDGIDRRGMILSFLMRFKQICNHPSQWLGDDEWAERDSGKLSRLREVSEIIASRQEKVLVFTQFREITSSLAAFLESVFERPGLVLHGGTEVKQRQLLVRKFQEDDRVPFFVLSLKAGGSGLNLTAASHVIHFDRWWNPAVEDQATDRAFRIGQTRNVLVHKFLCRGTLEEKIDTLIESKQRMTREVLEGSGSDVLITEMSDEELLSLVSLDLKAALSE